MIFKSKNFLSIILFIFFLINTYAQKDSKNEIDKKIEQSFKSFAKVDLTKSLSEASEALRMSEKANYNNGIIKSNVYISKILIQIQQYSKALEYIQKAEKIDGFKKDLSMVVETHRLKGMIFTYSKTFQFADEEFRNQISTSLKLKEPERKTISLFYAYQNLAHLYTVQGLNDSVQVNLNKARHLIKEVKIEHQIISYITIYNQLAENFIKKSETDSAKYYLNKAESLTKQEKVAYTFGTLQLYGDLYVFLKDSTLAISYYEKALANAQDLKNKNAQQELHKILADLYQNNDSKKVIQHIIQYNNLRNNIDTDNVKITEEISTYLINIEKEKFANVVIAWCISIVFVLLIVHYFFIKRKIKNYKNRLKYKRELLDENNKLINNLKYHEKRLDTENLIKLAKENSPEFLFLFLKLFPNFSKKLHEINPDLKNTEITFCAYLKLQFSTKEIANYTYTSVKTVQNKKNAIRKRLNITSDSDIYIWFSEIE